MILFLASVDQSMEHEVLRYLVQRSVTHVDVGVENPFAVVGGLDEHSHHVLTGNGLLQAFEYTKERVDVRLVFLGSKKDAVGPLVSLFDQANVIFSSHDDDLFERLGRFVSEAMASYVRPSWDEYFMEIAQVVARRGNCMKRRVAAVVVKDNRIVATGYNGTPKGAKNCNEGGCTRCNSLAPSGTDLDECICNHAEENAIAQAAFHGTSLKGASIYCTLSPCSRCTKLIINAGLKQVVYNGLYPLSQRSMTLLEECNVSVRQFELSGAGSIR